MSKYKSRISLYDLSQIIYSIDNFDKRVSYGDEALVEEIAKATKDFENNGVNLFSLATKYCHYHNRFVYKRDDYSIYDSVVSQNLYILSLANNPIDKITPDKWRNDIDYKSFNKYVGAILDSLGIDDSVNGRRRFFDHYLWYQFM